MKTDLIFAYVTCASSQQAKDIARTLVKERLVACANIYADMRSVYEWQGKLCDESETILILKTRAKLFDKVSRRVKALHSYECPCIVGLPIAAVHKPFGKWIKNQTKRKAAQ